jgi:hypothetical protein
MNGRSEPFHYMDGEEYKAAYEQSQQAGRELADLEADIRQASTGGPDFTVKDYPDPSAAAAEEALSAAYRVVARIWLQPVNDAHGQPAWTCRECHVAGAHLDSCRIGETLDALRTLDAARSGPASPGEGLDVERLARAMFEEGIAPFRSRSKAEAHGFDERYRRNARDLAARLATEPR